MIAGSDMLSSICITLPIKSGLRDVEGDIEVIFTQLCGTKKRFIS